MSKKSFIDSVEVKNPCTEDWGNMHGNERVRFCEHCAKDVNNISEMTRKEAMRLVRASGGNLCIRYVQNPVTKRPLFAEQLLQITRRTPQLAAGVVSASVSLSTLTYAQGGVALQPVSEPVNECPDKAAKIEVSSETNSRALPIEPAAAYGSVRGTIRDPNEAVIPNARVVLINEVINESTETTSDADGTYEFSGLGTGTYSITVNSGGFGALRREAVKVSDKEVWVDFVMQPAGSGTVLMGVVGYSPEYTLSLNTAISDEDIDLVRELIAQGENVNGKDENYNKITPLFVAVEHGNVEIVEMLLDARAKVNARDESKRTPLMQLDGDATPELVELLLRHGAKVNLTDERSNTALVFAAASAPAEVVKALIDAGADVNVANKEGWTALMAAAQTDSLEKVRILLEAGAKANAKNDDDWNAWEMASDDEVKELLAMYGAETKIEVVETEYAPEVPSTD